MKKYLQVFKISFQQEFAYRVNFIMWRVRNVLQIFLIFFLWDTVFADPERIVFGYDRAKILTYVFGLIVMRSVVLSTRSIDMPGEIARGDITNLMLKPINYFKYWFTRDLSSKALNLAFAAVEGVFLYFILKPQIYFQNNIYYLSLFILSLAGAIILYFLLVFLFSTPPFWIPHFAWGFMFLLFVFTDLLGGGVFPLDIFPQSLQNLVYLTPFPYLLFIPVEIYLGKFGMTLSLKFLAVSFLWILVLAFINKKIWSLGFKAYRAEGR